MSGYYDIETPILYIHFFLIDCFLEAGVLEVKINNITIL